MSVIIDGTSGITDTGTLSVTGVTTLTGGLNAALPVLSGGTGVTTKTGTGAVVLGTSPSISGAVMTTMASSVITSGTAVASTSGTSIDFTSIPSWVKRITVMFKGVGTSGTSIKQIQLGSGSVTTSGYISGGTIFSASVLSSTAPLTSGLIIYSYTASERLSGLMVISLEEASTNTWVESHGMTNNNSTSTNYQYTGNGHISLAGVLDRVRVTTVNGTDTFAAGSVNILYE